MSASKPIIAAHIDLKGFPPLCERMLHILDLMAATEYKAVVIEWEDMFPWRVDKRFRCETAYTEEEVARIHERAVSLGLDVIPLVQCLGHMETPLRLADYAHLREVPCESGSLNPLAPGARELVEEMLDDVLSHSPTLRYVHLGGDESWGFGSHPDTKRYVAEHGAGGLYLHHVEPLLKKLAARGIRPILWHDMMIDWDDESLKRIGAQADICVWGYHHHPDTTRKHCATKHMKRFHENGIAMWAGGAYKCNEAGPLPHPSSMDVPDRAVRYENARAWIEVAERFSFVGMIATGWGRTSTDCTQSVPIDGALDTLVGLGLAFSHGAVPSAEEIGAALERCGERERFERVSGALTRMSAQRTAAWSTISNIEEMVATARFDPRRRGSRTLPLRVATLNKQLAALKASAADFSAACADDTALIWRERYAAERIEPIERAYERFAKEIERYDRYEG
ncbi:MAG: family 20 glycosylhydrolase [Candidatus Sumerlaeota bacterium]|nr:family 20 glycosylhydrolase [Candidatus Sumerlaeota bacterium]